MVAFVFELLSALWPAKAQLTIVRSRLSAEAFSGGDDAGWSHVDNLATVEADVCSALGVVSV
jgi:hypothetical protein